MQPRPRADTSSPLVPNVRFCIVLLTLEAYSAYARDAPRDRPNGAEVAGGAVLLGAFAIVTWASPT